MILRICLWQPCGFFGTIGFFCARGLCQLTFLFSNVVGKSNDFFETHIIQHDMFDPVSSMTCGMPELTIFVILGGGRFVWYG